MSKRKNSKLPEELYKEISIDMFDSTPFLNCFKSALGTSENNRAAIFIKILADMKKARDQWEKRIATHIKKERLRKLLILQDYYGYASTKSLHNFALDIACDFIRGFEVKFNNPKRRRVVWDELLYAKLFIDVDEIKQQDTKISDKAALAKIIESHPWKGLPEMRDSLDTLKKLQNRYSKAKMRLLSIDYSLASPQKKLEIKSLINSFYREKPIL